MTSTFGLQVNLGYVAFEVDIYYSSFFAEKLHRRNKFQLIRTETGICCGNKNNTRINLQMIKRPRWIFGVSCFTLSQND